MEKGRRELVTIVLGVLGSSVAGRVRPLPRLVPLHAATGFTNDLCVGRRHHGCFVDSAATAGLATGRIAQERTVEVVAVPPATLLNHTRTLFEVGAEEDFGVLD